MSEPEYPRRAWVAAAKRDAGLRRITAMTRRIFIGALAATGVFAALAAHSFAGKASRATASSQGPTSPADPASPPTTQAPSDDTQPYYFQPPQQVPQPSYGYGHVRSGGS